jgi:CTP:phosphocholine cytidylyltransferase-like protein
MASNLPFNGVVADVDLDEDHAEKFKHQRKHYNVTMAKFYDYQLQHRNTDGIALLWGDRLRHQYIVDAYVVIKQNRLRYLCLNQKKLRADVYQGL